MAQDTHKPGDAMAITRAYYDSMLIEMRHLDGVLPSTEVEIFGEKFATPVMMAALSHLKGRREDAMVQMAAGAKRAGSLMWWGMSDTDELDAIVATGARAVKIIKPYADREMVYTRLRHAKQAGALAVGMDIDHQFSRKGEYDDVLGHAMRPVTTAELAQLIGASALPFVVKGVLSVQDAVKCLRAGAAGIVLSHHNGIIPYAVPPLMVLPDIAKAVGGQMKIFVDCGVQSGADAFKALALGADAVSVGKPMIEAVVQDGAEGVAEKINEINQELAGIMARTCCARVGDIDASLIHPHW